MDSIESALFGENNCSVTMQITDGIDRRKTMKILTAFTVYFEFTLYTPFHITTNCILTGHI